MGAQIEALKKKQLDLEHEELAKLEKFQKDLRGKDYSYDFKGNIVMLQKVSPPTNPVQLSEYKECNLLANLPAVTMAPFKPS